MRLPHPKVSLCGNCLVIAPWKVIRLTILGLIIYRRINIVLQAVIC